MKPTPTSEDEYFCIQHNPTTTNMPSVQNDPKIGEIVQEQLIPLIQKAHGQGLLTMQDMQELQNWTLSSFPVLRREAEIPEPEHRRYYVDPITLFGVRYRVCNHWYTRNKPEVQKWLDRLHAELSSFPEFRMLTNRNLSTTATRQNYKDPRCRIDIDEEKLSMYSDEDRWIFDCNVDTRRVYWAKVGDMRAAFNRCNVASGGKYQFSIDDVEGHLYTASFTQPILALNRMTDASDYILISK